MLHSHRYYVVRGVVQLLLCTKIVCLYNLVTIFNGIHFFKKIVDLIS